MIGVSLNFLNNEQEEGDASERTGEFSTAHCASFNFKAAAAADFMLSLSPRPPSRHTQPLLPLPAPKFRLLLLLFLPRSL